MTGGVPPILLGEDYQHRFFWIYAARLYWDDEPAEVVYLEHPIIKAFDDVVARHRVALYSWDNRSVEIDHFQLKYHVDNRETIQALDLADPAFIGATRYSLLERAYAATESGDIPARLTLVTAWRIDQTDILRKLVTNFDGSIVVDRLFDGKSSSDAAIARETWRNRLGGVSDEDLARVLRHLRIWDGYSMRALAAELAWALDRAGLVPPPESQLDDRYVATARRFIEGKMTEHRAETLRPILENAGLWRGRRGRTASDPRDVAIRSFARSAIDLHDHAATLDLVPAFRGRYKAAEVDWDRDLAPRIRDFLDARITDHGKFDLYLDTHLSIAYLAGYLLGKTDADVAPVQREARAVWRASGIEVSGELWTIREEQIGDGPGLAVAVEVTRPTAEDARIYAAKEAPGIGRMLVLTIKSGTGPTSVLGADHARALARDLARIVDERRTPDERTCPVHLFASVPVALAFLIGREGRAFGRSIAYEFDFDTRTPGGYTPAFHTPLQA